MAYLKLYVRSKKGGFIPSFLFSGDSSIFCYLYLEFDIKMNLWYTIISGEIYIGGIGMGRIVDLTSGNLSDLDGAYFIIDKENGLTKKIQETVLENFISNVVPNVESMALNTQAGPTSVDGQLYAAIVNLGWDSEVITND